MPDTEETIAYCHSCGGPMDVSSVAPFTNVVCPQCGKHTRVKREFGPYTLVRRHAVGGMSMVFAAHDNTLNREVALKILSEDYSADERRIAAFEEEARLTASFSHPNVVRVLTTGYAFDRFYIAMEFVPGGHFEHQIKESGTISEEELLPLAIEVAQGLRAAHAAGLIHRDVKPGNILLDAEGHAKLVDFGLALVTHGGKATATELWATPYYVPPETVEGNAEDFRSDIYAFGATLYHALSGKPPCGEESMATDLLREAKKKVVPLSVAAPHLSVETCRIVERAMAYQPDDRFSSYDEMITLLTSALKHLKSGQTASIGTVAKRRGWQKNKVRVTVAASVIVILIVAGGVLKWSSRGTPASGINPPSVPPAPPKRVPPAAVDKSESIAKCYREARAALEARNFEKAARDFGLLHKNPGVQEPSRTWAGMEAVLACLLDARLPAARSQAAAVLKHFQSLPPATHSFSPELSATLQKLGQLQLIEVPHPDSKTTASAAVITAMLAGLKNWEQGMVDAAAACFTAALAIKLPPEEEWAGIYQKLAADYLADYQVLGDPLFHALPADKAGCEAALDQLNQVLGSLKTHGRARFNVRAWQLDVTRQLKLIGNAPPVLPAHQIPSLADVNARLAGFSRDCRFTAAIAYLKSLPADPPGATRASLIAVAEGCVTFLADMEEDLKTEPVTADLQLKSGEIMARIFVDSTGILAATSLTGHTRKCEWSDFSPASLITLHRILVKNPKSEPERLRRHECAISFEWLAGSRERACTAAAVLAQGSEIFKQHWNTLYGGLPK